MTMPTKTCTTCERSLPIEAFATKPRGDGHQPKCRACTREYSRNWYRENRERRLARAKQHYAENRDAILRRQRAHRRATFRREQARGLLRNAVLRGDVRRPENCSRCGKRGRIQGHHHDYSKPLDVIWLCVACHLRLHGKERTNGLLPQ